MDEEKRKHLEKLRKELDPEILKKMARYMGVDEAATSAAVAGLGSGGGSSSAPRTESVSSGGLGGRSSAEKIRERRASAFQERIAQRKRRQNASTAVPEKKENTFDHPIYVFSSMDIWTKIVESQFRSLGYPGSLTFSSFSELLEHILKKHMADNVQRFDIAVGLMDLKPFIRSWQDMFRKDMTEHIEKFLREINCFFVVESRKQLGDEFIRIYGEDRVIAVTDDIQINREKVLRAAGGADPKSGSST